MRTFLIAFGVFTVTLALIIFSITNLSSKLYELEDIVTELAENTDSTDFAKQERLLSEFREKWEKNLWHVYLSVDHTYITAVDEALSRVRGAVEAEDTGLASAGTLMLRNALQNLHDLIRPNINSLI